MAAAAIEYSQAACAFVPTGMAWPATRSAVPGGPGEAAPVCPLATRPLTHEESACFSRFDLPDLAHRVEAVTAEDRQHFGHG